MKIPGLLRRPGILVEQSSFIAFLSRMLVAVAVPVVVARSAPDGMDCAISVCENVVAVDVTPLVALRRTLQVIGAIVHLVSAIPILLGDPGAPLPLVVMAIRAIVVPILRLRLVMAILVRMLLREGRQAEIGRAQYRECKRFYHSVHSYSWNLRFLHQMCCCLKKTSVRRYAGNQTKQG